VTRTTALQDVLRARLFGEATIDQPHRDVQIINATDLRSGTAYRFGSTESGCTRYGKLVDNAIPVERAVAASAAFPLLLPAIDRLDAYRGWDGITRRERFVLNDGGVYDNLATTSLRPGRSPAYSTNVYPVDYIVSCDAGYGVMDATAFPVWWPSRVTRSFGAVHRKAQDAQRAALHAHKSSGELRGFAMAFLGQQDHRLPMRPPDLVPRSRVIDYPTYFSAMIDENITALTTRGERLMRLAIEHHCPEMV
jgi:NTE family protein